MKSPIEQTICVAMKRLGYVPNLGGKGAKLTVQRVTGDPGKSGVFQCYKSGRASNSIGPSWHGNPVTGDVAVRRHGEWVDVFVGGHWV